MDEAWERAVEVACAGQDPQAVRSLTLDGSVKCSQGRLPARALLERYLQLRVLSIANVGLTSLADFPSLKHLERLNLSDNRISGGLEFLVDAGLHSLRDLDLSNNKIQQLDDLAPLAQLNLLSLDLYECPITRLQGYRPKVFSLIKSLQYLDKVDAEDNERPESDEEEDDVDDDGVDDEDAAGLRSNGYVDQEDEDGEDSEELDEEDEENVQYPIGANHIGQSNEETGSEEEEIDDEEDTEQVLEVEESEDEEGAEDEEDVDDEEDDDDGTEGTNTGVDGEIDAQDEGEEDNSELGDEDDEGDEGVDDDEGDEEDEEEDLGTEYLVQPIAQPEDEEGASDFEPGEDEYAEDDDDIDDDEDEAEPAAAALKRKRSKAEDDDEDDEEERPPKK